MFTPTNRTPCSRVFWCTCSSSGISLRQGPHHDPHTFTTTTSPRRSARSSESPSRVSPAIVGAGGRSPGGYSRRVSSASVPPPPPSPAVAFTATATPTTRAAASASTRGVRRRMALRPLLVRDRRLRHQVGRRLGVLHRRHPLTLEVQRRDARQRALPPARVVPQPPPLQVQPQGPDRQLVGDAERLMPLRRGPGGLHRGEHPGGDLGVRLAPGGPERVAQGPPLAGMPQ